MSEGHNVVSTSSPIYLDYNATTPLDPEVIDSIVHSLKEHWANPSSKYFLGVKSKQVVEASRLRIAEMLKAPNADDIIFTSGGTEANHLAIVSATTLRCTDDESFIPHVITSNVEHDSVIKLLVQLERARSIDLSIATVNKDTGVLDVEQVLSLITPTTRLITVMHANNETGVIMPIAEIGQRLEGINRQSDHSRILFHTDAAQTIGKIDVNVMELKVDYLTVVGHKFYGPRIGALYARKVDADNVPTICPAFHGGGQERGLRSGTENTCMINGLGTACLLVKENIQTYKMYMEKMRIFFKTKLLEHIPGVVINFDESHCLPNTLSVAVPEHKLASEVLSDCSDQICASLGAACHSHNSNGSGVLISSGLPVERAIRTIRFSVGRSTTEPEIETAVEILAKACNI